MDAQIKLKQQEFQDPDCAGVARPEHAGGQDTQNKALQAEVEDLKMENAAMLITLESMEKEIFAAQAGHKGSDAATSKRLESKNAVIKQQEQDLKQMAEVIKRLEERLASTQQTLLQYTVALNAPQPDQPENQPENAQDLENLLDRIDELETELEYQKSLQKQAPAKSDEASASAKHDLPGFEKASKPAVSNKPGASERSLSIPSEQNVEAETIRSLQKALEIQESMYQQLEAELGRERQRCKSFADKSPRKVLGELHEQLDVAADRVAELEIMNDEANRSSANAKNREAGLERKIQELEKFVGLFAQSAELSEESIATAVASSVAKAEDDKKNLRETIELLEDKISVAERDQEDRKVAQNRVPQLEGLVDELKKRVADLELQLRDQEGVSNVEQERKV